MEYTEKNPKKRSPAGIIFLILLLLILGGIGYLYYSVTKAPLTLDDPAQLAFSAPMTPGERFSVFPEDGTVQAKLEAADLWAVILAEAGEDFLDEINGALASYDLTISGCGIHMDQEGLQLETELFYKEKRLAAKIPCSLSITGQHICLTPTAVKLGVISLPIKNLLSQVKLEYDLVLPVVSQVTEVRFEEGAILLSGTVDQDIQALIPQGSGLYKSAIFRPALKPAADALNGEEGFVSLLEQWERDPGSLEETYRQLFSLANAKDLENYRKERSALLHRFFPGIDFDTLTDGELTGQVSMLEQFFTNASNDYNEKNFLLKNGTFFLYGKAFQAAQYSAGKYDPLFEVLDPESCFLILVNAQDGFIRKTSSFNRMAGEGLEFTQEVDYNRTYILGCVLRSVAGEAYLLYETEIQQNNTYSRSIKAIPLTEEEVNELHQEGKFGVWTG